MILFLKLVLTMILFMSLTYSPHLLGCQWRHHALSLGTVCYMLSSILMAVFSSFSTCWPLAFIPLSIKTLTVGVPLFSAQTHSSMCTVIHSGVSFMWVNTNIVRLLKVLNVLKVNSKFGDSKYSQSGGLFLLLGEVHPLKTTKTGGVDLALH